MPLLLQYGEGDCTRSAAPLPIAALLPVERNQLAMPLCCELFIGKSFYEHATDYAPSLKANLFSILRVIPVSQGHMAGRFIDPTIDGIDYGVELLRRRCERRGPNRPVEFSVISTAIEWKAVEIIFFK